MTESAPTRDWLGILRRSQGIAGENVLPLEVGQPTDTIKDLRGDIQALPDQIGRAVARYLCFWFVTFLIARWLFQ